MVSKVKRDLAASAESRREIIGILLDQLDVDDSLKDYLRAITPGKTYIWHTTLSGGYGATSAGVEKERRVAHLGDVRTYITRAIGWDQKGSTITDIQAAPYGAEVNQFRTLYGDEPPYGLGVNKFAPPKTRAQQRRISAKNERRLKAEAEYQRLYTTDPEKAKRYMQRVEAGRKRWNSPSAKIPKKIRDAIKWE